MSIAIYPGTFDPITFGHLDIIERASKHFDKVIVLVSVNSSKQPAFTLQERCSLISSVVDEMKNVQVDSFSGLLVDYVKSVPDAVIVKGLRALLDFEYEFQMALVNRHLDGDVETFFLMTSMDYAHISSSLVKEILKYGGDVSNMVPKSVINAYKKRGISSGN